MTSPADATPDPDITSGVESFERAVDQLVTTARSPLADGPDALSRDELVSVLQRLEIARNRLQTVDSSLIDTIERAGVPDRWLTRTVPGTLTTILKLSRSEARRRVSLARDTRPGQALSGATVDPTRPVLAAALDAGTVTPDQGQVIMRCLTTLTKKPHLGAHQVGWAEATLVGLTRALGPEDLRNVAIRICDVLDPDGTLDDDAQHNQRDLTLARRDGMYILRGKLTNELGAKLWALLQSRAAPRPTDATGPDSRTPGQRNHDALADFVTFLANLAGKPTTDATTEPDTTTEPDSTTGPDWSEADLSEVDDGCRQAQPSTGQPQASKGTGLAGLASWISGPTATVIVTVKQSDLISGTGHAETSDGALLTIPQLLTLADQAEIIPAFLNDTGAVLALGRTRRFATRNQTLAMIARDGGCSFPACRLPGEWCDRHHLISWAEGGLTDLDNLTLLCGYHHDRALNQGWRCRLNADRLVEWIPPRYIDPDQVPIVCRPLARAAPT